MPVRVTIDGALDAIAHTFEVFCGAKGDKYDMAKDLCETAVSLVVDWAGKISALLQTLVDTQSWSVEQVELISHPSLLWTS